MTEDQFAALATLARLRAGPAQVGAHLVLVHGLRVTDAAVQAGVSQSGLSNTLGAVRRTLRLAQAASAGAVNRP